MIRILVSAALLGLVAGGAAAQSPAAQEQLCESERNQLRWLVQKYGSERTNLEFALAASEARRQLVEERIKALEVEMERGKPARPKPGGS